MSPNSKDDTLMIVGLVVAGGALAYVWYKKPNCKPAEEKDHRIKAKYLLMDAGVLDCPINYTRIHDGAQCKAATLSFGLNAPNHTKNLPHYSSGCIVETNHLLRNEKDERADGGTLLNNNSHLSLPQDAQPDHAQKQRIFCQQVPMSGSESS